MGVDRATAHKLVSAMVRSESVVLRSTENQQSCYYDLERTLKPLMVDKVIELMKRVYPHFF
jgi:hypothetical protein